ncbi:MAG TPA: glycosyltransferase family 39 protein [Thermoanaerobaculia bacterium]|jgi:hypothetical protein|nr:glycosyltransferase family 39 protein [Thermoanaerobaculia bacterium]
MIASLLFVFQHAAVLALLLVITAATGTAVAGARVPLALRSALGLAVAGQAFAILGAFGVLRPWTICIFIAIALAAGAARMERSAVRWGMVAAGAATALPLFVLAIYPPIAFDETLYHLPFVRAIAGSGAIRFLTDLRFPAFPQLHELLCVPAFLLAGDTATHLVATAEVLLLAALLIVWPRQRHAGFFAAALVLGNPIVLQMATVTHVECGLMLFVAAGAWCLDRATSENPRAFAAAAGFLFGTACSAKYLGWYFAVAALVFLVCFGPDRRRTIPIFLLAFAAAVVPTYACIVAFTGNPVFPFLPEIFGATPWTISMSEDPRPVARAARLFWDITFARERVLYQPPYSLLFAGALLVTIVAAAKNRRLAFLSAVCAGYLAIFIVFLPQDSRYLLPLLPLVSVAAASVLARWKTLSVALSVLSIAGGLAYVGFRVARQGPPPLNAAQRQQYLEQRVPEYRALERRGTGRIYVCGAEHLKDYGGADVVGDFYGPLSIDEVIGGSRDASELSASLARIDVRYLLVSRKRCPPEWQRLPASPAFELVYADDGALLWRVSGGR